MKFQEVVSVFVTIEKVTSRNQIMELLADLFHKATPDEAQMITYLSIGQVRPTYLGSQFNSAEKTIKKVIQEITQLSDADLAHQIKKYGDLGTLLSVQAWQPHEHLTLKHVFDALVELQTITGEGSHDTRAQFLTTLLRRLSPAGAGFVVRIILGKLRTGFSDMTIIDAFSWMLVGNKSMSKQIEHAYNMCADLGLIAYKLKKDGQEALKEISITLGIPILPSLAERLPTASEIVDKLGTCAAQPKLDGFRLQVHIKKNREVHFYSRNLIDMSPMFPELTQAAQKLRVKDAIFEGEAIVFDESTGAFLPFQETVKRKRKHDIAQVAQEFPLKLFVFDLLYLNGESMLNKEHETRRKQALTFLSTDHTETISLIDERVVTTAAGLEDYFLECIEEGLEGLVVKKMNAQYQPGKRNFNWIKLKRTQESGTLTDTIDAVILGYYYGRGRRAALGIGAFLIGVYDKKKDRFETIAKVGTGLSDQGFRDIKKLCDAMQVEHKPFNVVCAKELFPDVWVAPELVWVVIADEITRSPLHTAGKTEHELGYALRFPRALEQRFDKQPDQATTVQEIKEMFAAIRH
ncbi:MAG: ATP-dependent DNA ligase [Candidatus Babeliaceae bacterium]|nr:ATP-dependent DNA ligase [Candidatus Babeliaceae bacterium]